MQRFSLIILITLFIINTGFSQNDSVKFYSPVNYKILLSGNFGETRTNHFHAGIDIKTGGVEGKEIFSIADGYISRIKITEGGYGKALYITHPNGYTSVYGHLQRFNNTIESYTKNIQYEKQSFTVNIFPEKNELPVKGGELIALSGNTGSSAGPHLHFEVRRSDYQVPRNPLLYNFPVEDTIAPKPRRVYFYEQMKYDSINLYTKKDFACYKVGNNSYRIKNPVVLSSEFGVGVEVFDYLNGSHNKCGAYTIDLYLDSSLIYHHIINEIPFDVAKFINAHLDYEELKKHKRHVQKLFISEFNKLNIYDKVVNNGIINIADTNLHQLSIAFSDVNKNVSEINIDFKVNQNKARQATPNYQAIIPVDSEFVFDTSGFRLKAQAYSVYEPVLFQFAINDELPISASRVYKIHDSFTPLHKPIEIAIQPTKLDSSLIPNYYITSWNDKNELTPSGGYFEDGFVKATISKLGDYAVVVDTLKPEIKLKNFTEGQDLSNSSEIQLEIFDHESGIMEYMGYIDGEWALFEFDPKNDLLRYEFDPKRIEKGKTHDLEIIVTDNRDNMRFLNTKFYW